MEHDLDLSAYAPLNAYAVYHALDWAEGRTIEEIHEEIARLDRCWAEGHAGNAHQTYGRIETLKIVLAKRQETK